MRHLGIGVLLLALRAFAQTPTFEVASIKVSTDPPGHAHWGTDVATLRVDNMSLKGLIQAAFQIRDFQISGGPGWLDDERYNINAKAAGRVDDDQMQAMFQNLLKQRFQLTFHRDTHPASGFALVLAKGGLKIKPNTTEGDNTTHRTRNSLTAERINMSSLAAQVARQIGVPVVDGTGIEGNFDLKLTWDPQETAASDLLPLPQALQQQIGVKLESRKVSVEGFIIDSVAKPSEN